MTHEAGYIEFQYGKLSYVKMGTGKRLLLDFHGYGNTAALFNPFNRYLSDDFTIISVNLPHHAGSTWQEHKTMSVTELKHFAEQMMKQFGVERVSLAGYSMGGRMCLCLVESIPQKIESCLLVASDGLVFNPFYYFVTRTFVGKRMFRKFLSSPHSYKYIADWLRKMEWIDASKYRFFMGYLQSEADRAFLLNVWPTMRELIPASRKLRAAIRTLQIPVFVFMGQHDTIIPAQHAQKFSRGLSTVKLFILDKGHRLFDHETLPKMADCLTKGTC